MRASKLYTLLRGSRRKCTPGLEDEKQVRISQEPSERGRRKGRGASTHLNSTRSSEWASSATGGRSAAGSRATKHTTNKQAATASDPLSGAAPSIRRRMCSQIGGSTRSLSSRTMVQPFADVVPASRKLRWGGASFRSVRGLPTNVAKSTGQGRSSG